MLCSLRMFNQQEVQILLGGVDAPVDLDDLRKNTNYGGIYDDQEVTITLFWNVSSLLKISHSPY
jgi:ubiquitin-protein ligase E3 C